MSDLFNSELIRKEVSEISALQKKILERSSSRDAFDNDHKFEQIKLLKELVERQKLIYTRFSLMEDPEAKDVLKRMIATARGLNDMPPDTSLYEYFNQMEKRISRMMQGFTDVRDALDNLD